MQFTSFLDKLLGTKNNQRIKINDATNTLLFGYRLLGLNAPKKYRMPYLVFSGILNFSLCIFVPIAFTVSLIEFNMEMGKFLTSLQACFNAYGSTIKVITIYLALPELRASSLVMDKLDGRCVEEQEKNKIRSYIQLGNRTVIYFTLVYYAYTTSSFLSAVIMGVPPYSLWFPFINWRNSTWEFFLASFVEYILVTLVCSQQVLDDSYAVVYVGILRTHLDILLERVSKLCTEPKKSVAENTEDLINCIMDHKDILTLYNTFHSIISITIFVQFTISAIMASITLINILVFGTITSAIGSLVYFFAVGLQIFPCCYYSNCLLDESDLLANAIFHSNWVDQDIKYRKTLFFFMHRTQQNITLTAGKLFPITLNSFLGIAKFSFSLYTLLNGFW